MIELKDPLVSYEYVFTMAGLWEGEPESCEDADEIKNLINWISSAAVREAGRELVFKERTIVLDAHGSSNLYLPVAPIVGIESLQIRRSYMDVWIDIPISEYYYSVNGAVVSLYTGRFPRAPQGARVVYQAGYSIDTVPDDVKKACLEAIMGAWTKTMDRAYGRRSITQSNGTNTVYDFELSYQVRQAFQSLALPSGR